MPKRPTPRAATTGEHVALLAGRLTARDRWLARMLYEHKVLTTDQIVELCFPTMRAANHRLLNLFKWRFVDRFQPFVSSGTAPMHYVLDIAGATTLAHEDGVDPKTLRYRHDDTIGIAHSLRLAHSVGVNGFFTNLAAASRTPDATGQLTTWWSERRCNRLFGDTVRPDGYGRWSENDLQIEWFLEFDFGTEALPILARKLYGYHTLAAETRIQTPVLIWLTSSRRETAARRVLAEVLSQLDDPRWVPVATTTADLLGTMENSVTSARWLPIADSSSPSNRLRLAELGRYWPRATVPAPPKTSSPVSASSEPVTELVAPPPLPPFTPASPFRTRERS